MSLWLFSWIEPHFDAPISQTMLYFTNVFERTWRNISVTMTDIRKYMIRVWALRPYWSIIYMSRKVSSVNTPFLLFSVIYRFIDNTSVSLTPRYWVAVVKIYTNNVVISPLGQGWLFFVARTSQNEFSHLMTILAFCSPITMTYPILVCHTFVLPFLDVSCTIHPPRCW